MCFWVEESRVSWVYCFNTRGLCQSCQNRCHEKLAASSDPEETSWILGLTGYYHKFFKDYGRIGASLTTLLKKDAFVWTSTAKCAFEKLKRAMCTTPILAMPNFSKPFTIESDACNNGIGSVLL